MAGTALYSTHAMANHACVGHNLRAGPYNRVEAVIANTNNRSAASASASASASSTSPSSTSTSSYECVGHMAYSSAAIARGEEVLSCYLTGEQTNVADGLSRGKRAEALSQYLFSCDCARCEAEAGDSEESDDGAEEGDY